MRRINKELKVSDDRSFSDKQPTLQVPFGSPPKPRKHPGRSSSLRQAHQLESSAETSEDDRGKKSVLERKEVVESPESSETEKGKKPTVEVEVNLTSSEDEAKERQSEDKESADYRVSVEFPSSTSGSDRAASPARPQDRSSQSGSKTKNPENRTASPAGPQDRSSNIGVRFQSPEPRTVYTPEPQQRPAQGSGKGKSREIKAGPNTTATPVGSQGRSTTDDDQSRSRESRAGSKRLEPPTPIPAWADEEARLRIQRLYNWIDNHNFPFPSTFERVYLDDGGFNDDELFVALQYANFQATKAVERNIQLMKESSRPIEGYRTVLNFADTQNGDGDGRQVFSLESVADNYTNPDLQKDPRFKRTIAALAKCYHRALEENNVLETNLSKTTQMYKWVNDAPSRLDYNEDAEAQFLSNPYFTSNILKKAVVYTKSLGKQNLQRYARVAEIIVTKYCEQLGDLLEANADMVPSPPSSESGLFYLWGMSNREVFDIELEQDRYGFNKSLCKLCKEVHMIAASAKALEDEVEELGGEV